MFSIKPILLTLSLLSLAHSFDEIAVPSTIAAGTDAQLSIVNDISIGSSSFDAGFADFRVYLSTTPPGWGSGPVCWLVNSTKISTTEVTINIPASVGPDADTYMITTMEFNPDPDMDGPSGFQYTKDFSFTGGTGFWSEYETSGHGIGDADNIPCTAYACARNCSQAFYPANAADDDNDSNADITPYKNTYECVAACPGVTYESWDAVIAQGNDESDGGEDGEDGSSGTSSDGSSPSQTGSATSISESGVKTKSSATTTNGGPTSTGSMTTSTSGSTTASSTGSSKASSTSSASKPSSSSSDSNTKSVALKWIAGGFIAQILLR